MAKLIKADLESSITDSLAHDEGDLLTRFVLVAEFMTLEGQRYLARDWEGTMMSWDIDALVRAADDGGWED